MDALPLSYLGPHRLYQIFVVFLGIFHAFYFLTYFYFALITRIIAGLYVARWHRSGNTTTSIPHWDE